MPWKSPSSQPTSCACAMPQLGVARRLARERQRHLGRAPCAGRRRGCLRARGSSARGSPSATPARVVERRAAGLVEQRPHHRRDADQLGRPGDLLTVGLVGSPWPSAPGVQRVEDFGGHGAPSAVGSIVVTASMVIGERRTRPRLIRCRRLQDLDDDQALLGHLPHGPLRTLAGVAAVADAAVGLLVGAERRHLVDEHAAEVERAAPRAARRRGRRVKIAAWSP